MGLYHKNRERKRKTFWLIDTGAPLCYHDFRRETAANSIADKVSLGQGEASVPIPDRRYSPRPASYMVRLTRVQLRDRQYSLDGRRQP